MYTEIHDIETLKTYIATHSCLRCVVCQDLDLTGLTDLISSVPANGATFLGCNLTKNALAHIIATGGLVFPELPGLPYKPYRPALYTVEELMAGYEPGTQTRFLDHARDSEIYHHFSNFRKKDEPVPILEALAQRLHDHAIDDALYGLLEEHENVVAIMGGHKLKRGEAMYRDVAHLARRLTIEGYFVATGGGPGAMEAGNLGAWFAGYEAVDLDQAIATLSDEPDYHEDAYLELGFSVRDSYPDGAHSLAIPTWFYGHEPTNQFSSHIAKYFSNSIREDILLAIATSGVIFSPGSAGTIQEVFMDAAQNHYGSFKLVSPMIFLGTTFWTEQSPVYPLLKKLAEARQYGAMLTISDDTEEIISFIKNHRPVPYDPAFHKK